jgi:hypothetical protein
MRFEEHGGELRIIQPGAERVTERHSLHWVSALIGIPGTAFVYYAWFSGVSQQKALATGVALSLISAWAFWKSERLRDAVWTLRINREKRALELPSGVVAGFDEVRVVRCSAIENKHHTLTLVVQRNRGFQDILLCHMTGQDSDKAVFEAASAALAQLIGARHESRTYATSRANQFSPRPRP